MYKQMYAHAFRSKRLLQLKLNRPTRITLEWQVHIGHQDGAYNSGLVSTWILSMSLCSDESVLLKYPPFTLHLKFQHLHQCCFVLLKIIIIIIIFNAIVIINCYTLYTVLQASTRLNGAQMNEHWNAFACLHLHLHTNSYRICISTLCTTNIRMNIRQLLNAWIDWMDPHSLALFALRV